MSHQPGFWLATRQWSLAALLLSLTPQVVFAADCTYRKDALGHTRYQCDDGKQGTLREDALGNIKDSGTGTTWRKDALGNLKGAMALPIGKTRWAIFAAAMPKPVNG